MRDRNGISIILADSNEAVDCILKDLSVEEAFPFRSLEQVFNLDPEAVYFAIFRTKAEMEKFASFLSVKRGVMCVDGKREIMGFNVDWMQKIILKPRNPISVPRAVNDPMVKAMPAGFSIHLQGEKDDPYADLGYRR
ncbi:hypothetical protein D3C78_728440 [compost metagenome]